MAAVAVERKDRAFLVRIAHLAKHMYIDNRIAHTQAIKRRTDLLASCKVWLVRCLCSYRLPPNRVESFREREIASRTRNGKGAERKQEAHA